MQNESRSPKVSRLSIYIPECTETLGELVQGDNGTAMMITYCITMAFIVIANSLFIIGLYRTNSKRFTSAQRIFLVLSCSDLTAGCIYIPLKIYYMVKSPDTTCALSGARNFWSVFPIVFSGMTIMFLTIDRYLLMAGHKKKKNGYKGLVIYVVLTFCVSFGWGVWYTLVLQGSPSESTYKKVSVFFICLATFEVCVLAIALVFNVLIVQTVKSTTKNSSLKTTKKMAERKLSRTIVIIGSALVITYLPSVIGLYITGAFMHDLTSMEIVFTEREEIERKIKILLWMLVPTLINSGLNAAIFIMRNTKIKKMYKSVYNKKINWMEGDSNSDTRSASPASPIQSHGNQHYDVSQRKFQL